MKTNCSEIKKRLEEVIMELQKVQRENAKLREALFGPKKLDVSKSIIITVDKKEDTK
jgi:regulator of replication initiation timing